mgnify:FL=1
MPYQHDIEPSEAGLVLFPGWLTHGVRVHKGVEPRISLSFNIEFNTDLG